MAAVEKDILGDGSDGNPYKIDGVNGKEYDVVSMDFTTMKAMVNFL